MDAEKEGEDICQCLCQRNFIIDRPKKRPKRGQNEHNEGGSLQVDALAHRGMRVRIITLGWARVEFVSNFSSHFFFTAARLYESRAVQKFSYFVIKREESNLRGRNKMRKLRKQDFKFPRNIEFYCLNFYLPKIRLTELVPPLNPPRSNFLSFRFPESVI